MDCGFPNTLLTIVSLHSIKFIKINLILKWICVWQFGKRYSMILNNPNLEKDQNCQWVLDALTLSPFSPLPSFHNQRISSIVLTTLNQLNTYTLTTKCSLSHILKKYMFNIIYADVVYTLLQLFLFFHIDVL